MNLRDVTACGIAATYTSHRQRQGKLAWRIFTCTRHRRLAGWSVPGNLRRVGPGDPAATCGTVHDHRPHALIIVSHLCGWMGGAGWPSDLPRVSPDDWKEHLRVTHDSLAHIRSERAAITSRALELAAVGATVEIVALLANAETAAARRRPR
ncbi:hypothetical protein [Streptomyces niveus]|uniref:hypothetical protein n=1 Tax=Streptomyces niveus TaxID=193462 RepID=UPI0035DF69E8